MAVFVVAVAGLRGLDTELIPEISEGEFYFGATLPQGTPVEATDWVIQQMQASLVAEPGVIPP